MPNLDPAQFPALAGGPDPPPPPITFKKQYNIASNTYSKPPRTNDELLLRSTARFAIAINTLSHSFSDISSRDRNAHRFEQTFRKFASTAAKFYKPHGACTVDFHQKAGWVEIGFRNRTLRDHALEISLNHEEQTFKPLRAYSKWEVATKVTFDALPMDDEIGIGKPLENQLRTFLEKYGEVPRVTLLEDDPEDPGIFLQKAVAILIPNEATLPKKGEEHLGLTALPRTLTLLDMYTVEVNPDRCPRRCTRCREIGHAPTQCPKYGKQTPKPHLPYTPANQPDNPVGMKRHRGPIHKWITSASSDPQPPVAAASNPFRNATSEPKSNPFTVVTKKSPSPKPSSPTKPSSPQTSNQFEALTQLTLPPTANLKPTNNEPIDLIDSMDIDDNELLQFECSSPGLPTVDELMNTRN